MHFPIKQGKTKVSNRYFYYFLVRLQGKRVLLRRRGKGDIWEGLYEWPMIETTEPVEVEALLATESWRTLSETLERQRLNPQRVAYREHRLTHRLLHASLYLIDADAYSGKDYQIVPLSELDSYGMPILLRKLLLDMPEGWHS